MFDILPETHEIMAPIVHEQVICAREHVAWDVPLRYTAEKHLSTMTDSELDKNWKLNEFFGTIAVINLPEAKARLQLVTKELHSIGTKVFDVFTAINGRKKVPPSIWKKMQSHRRSFNTKTEEGREARDRMHQAEAGCYLSHYKLIKSVKEAFDNAVAELLAAQAANDQEAIMRAEQKLRKHSRVLILEDDAGFGIVNQKNTAASKKGVGKLLHQALRELPNDWDILYFIVHPTAPVKETSPHLRQISSSWCCIAYALNYTIYEPLVECLARIENPTVKHVWAYDQALGRFQHSYKTYAVYPAIAFHQEGPSQIIDESQIKLWQCQPIYKPNKTKHVRVLKNKHKKKLR